MEFICSTGFTITSEFYHLGLAGVNFEPVLFAPVGQGVDGTLKHVSVVSQHDHIACVKQDPSTRSLFDRLDNVVDVKDEQERAERVALQHPFALSDLGALTVESLALTLVLLEDDLVVFEQTAYDVDVVFTQVVPMPKLLYVD